MKTTISTIELAEMLKGLQGASPASILCETTKVINGREVIKDQHLSIFLNVHYGRAVNRKLEKEGIAANHVSSERKWGERIEKTPLVTHKGQTYVEAVVLKDLGHVLRDIITGRILNEKDKSSEQRVMVRDFKINNIRKIKLMGNEFDIK